MGIVKLAELIRREAPGAVSHKRIGDYAGKAVAMDTSITLCQFRAALPRLRNRDGAYLSSVMGLFYRTLHFLERGLKPVFVFEGRPPAQKRGALERRAEAEGRILGTERASSQTEDCQRLLRLLGVPYLQFVDLCILLGCDFCEKIRGLGPRKALDLIRKHKTIENVVLHINREVHPIPLCWKYQEARSLFLEAAGGYGGGQALSWTEPDEEGLVTFLCRERHMKEERVRRRLERFRAGLLERETEREEAGGGPAGRQTSLTQFFRVTRRRQAPDAEEAEGSCKKPRAQ
ncbi:probable flap endonuclease 1 homolog isoform X5 [Lepisosteus oculatus]|uniref:probable flap endonuclease 1 homolog isoform X5 n=1 Tax=Lepisosteus oculatus TaxID=7918 RepID=UPI0035F52D9C